MYEARSTLHDYREGIKIISKQIATATEYHNQAMCLHAPFCGGTDHPENAKKLIGFALSASLELYTVNFFSSWKCPVLTKIKFL